MSTSAAKTKPAENVQLEGKELEKAIEAKLKEHKKVSAKIAAHLRVYDKSIKKYGALAKELADVRDGIKALVAGMTDGPPEGIEKTSVWATIDAWQCELQFKESAATYAPSLLPPTALVYPGVVKEVDTAAVAAFAETFEEDSDTRQKIKASLIPGGWQLPVVFVRPRT